MTFYKLILSMFIFLTITLSCANLVIYNNQFYQEQFETNKVYDSIPIIRVQDQYRNLFRYFKGEQDLNLTYYSKKEALHLKDIKTLLLALKLINTIAILGLITTLAFYFKKLKIKKTLENLFVSSLNSLFSYLAILLILVLFPFEKLFYQIHTIIFRNDFWLLDPNSELLIVIFPPILFFNMLAMILLCCIILNIFTVTIIKKLTKIFE